MVLMRIRNIYAEVAPDILLSGPVGFFHIFGGILFTKLEVIRDVLDARLKGRNQANVQGIREIGANDVCTASDQDHSARSGQLTNSSAHAPHQVRCGRMKTKQFFKCVLKGRLAFLLDKLFQVLGRP